MTDFARFSVGETLFISGAGISLDSPTNGPLGPELMRDAMLGFALGTLDTIHKAYTELGQDPWGRPRLEVVLDIVVRVHGVDVLEQMLAGLSSAVPNDLHRFFAEHLDGGGRHITANFDTLIEDSLPTAVRAPTHFHGSFTGTGGVAALGARLATIESGFGDSMVSALRDDLLDPAISHVVITGYSGSDFFDMAPFVRELAEAGMLDHLQVTLLNHKQHDPTEVAVDLAEHAQLRPFSAGRAQLAVLAGLTTSSLGQLATHWAVAAPRHEPRVAYAPPVVSPLHPAQQTLASLELFSHMGLFSAIDALAAPATLPDGLRAEREWARARYRHSRRYALRAAAGPGPDLELRRRIIRAKYHWIRGSYFRAYHLSLGFLGRPDLLSGARPQTLAEAYEVIGLILVHMRRCPDIRRFSSDARRRWARTLIEDYRDAHAHEIGTAVRQTLESAINNLDHDGAPATTDVGSWMDSIMALKEVETLNTHVQFEHALLRKRVEGGDPVVNDDFRAIAKRYVYIGQPEGAFRLHFLPGAGYAFTARETALGLLRLNATWWHKVRLTGGLAREMLSARSREVNARSKA